MYNIYNKEDRIYRFCKAYLFKGDTENPFYARTN